MENESMNHSDCVNFAPVDALKGICRCSNNLILIDTPVCENFKETCKCKNCINFKDPDSNNIGICVGLNKDAWTSGELYAVTCGGYKLNK